MREALQALVAVALQPSRLSVIMPQVILCLPDAFGPR